MATTLLAAAVEYAFANGALRIDAYPKDTSLKRTTNPELFVGSLAMFVAAGFGEITRMGDRPVVRLEA